MMNRLIYYATGSVILWLLCEFGALRPLPKALIRYARSDTHYLLYVAEVLRGLLAGQDLLTEVLQRSQALCLRVRTSFLL